MKCYKRGVIYINPYNGCMSDGRNMHALGADELIHMLNYAIWDKDLADLAKSILEKQKQQIEKQLSPATKQTP